MLGPLSVSAVGFQDFLVCGDLASRPPALGPLDSGGAHRSSDGAASPCQTASTTACRYAHTDFPDCVQVASTVQIRSHHRCPVAPRVPCVLCRSITTNRIA